METTTPPGAAVLLTLAARRLAEPDRDETPLTPAELRRAQSIAAPAARHRYVAARQAARRFVASLAGVEPSTVAADYQCPQCRAASAQRRRRSQGQNLSHGVPRYLIRGRVFPVNVSFSRSGDWLLAASSSAGSLGVDLADLAGFGDPRLDAVIATAAERAELDAGAPESRALRQAQLWTRKEAILKATGDGLRIAPNLVEASGDSAAGVDPAGAPWERMRVADVDTGLLGLPSGLLAAAAVPAAALPADTVPAGEHIRMARISWE